MPRQLAVTAPAPARRVEEDGIARLLFTDGVTLTGVAATAEDAMDIISRKVRLPSCLERFTLVLSGSSHPGAAAVVERTPKERNNTLYPKRQRDAPVRKKSPKPHASLQIHYQTESQHDIRDPVLAPYGSVQKKCHGKC